MRNLLRLGLAMAGLSLCMGCSGLTGSSRAQSTQPADVQSVAIQPGPFSAAWAVQDVKAVGDAVAGYQLRNPTTRPVRKRQWVEATFYAGLIPYAQTTANQALLKDMWDIAVENQWQLGPSARFADDHCVGWAYAALYLIDPEPHMIAPLKTRFDEIEQFPHDEPLTYSDKIVHREWAWCDALFMGPATWTHLYRCTGDEKYLRMMNRLWWKSSDFLFDRDERLYYRDSRFFTRREANGQKVFWSRGNGWVVAGLARVLNDLPENFPDRPRYVEQFTQMCERLLPLQRADGSWPVGLLDPQTWNVPETSGTAFFTYAFMWGINHGLLDREKYLPAVEKGWKLLVEAVHPDGKLGWVQPIGASPAGVRADLTQSYGAGALLLAASEIYRHVMLKDSPSIDFIAVNPHDQVRINASVQVPAPRLFAEADDAQIVIVEKLNGKIVSKKQAKDVQETLNFHADFVPRERKTFTLHLLHPSPGRTVLTSPDRALEVTIEP